MKLFRIATVAIFTTIVVRAQVPPVTQAPVEAQPELDPMGRTTPYGTVTGFLKAASAKDYALAAQYLNVKGSRSEDLASQLKAVLDWGLPGNLTNLSRLPEGKVSDGLPAGRERIGKVETAAGELEIQLERIEPKNSPPIWLFASQTLRDLPETYKEIEEHDIAGGLPASLREIKFLDVPLWRWLASTIAIVLALVSASLVTRLLLALVQPVFRRYFRDEDVAKEGVAFKWPVRIVLVAVALQIFSLYSVTVLARSRWSNWSVALAIIGVAWLVIRVGNLISKIAERNLIWRQKPDKITMLSLMRRVFKIFVVLIAIVLLLQLAGVDVNKMLAGLGIGGIALALAAQKTLENVFGGISLIMREAARVGDTCNIAGQTGVIEDIGLGNTRVRTLDRTIVSVPNAQLSTQNLENLTMRDKAWFHHVFGLRYDTKPQQMRDVLAGIDEVLRNDSRVEKSSARVRFIAFGTSSFTIEIFAYVLEKDWPTFLRIQEQLLLAVLAVIEGAGAKVAIPVVVGDNSAPGGLPPPPMPSSTTPQLPSAPSSK